MANSDWVEQVLDDLDVLNQEKARLEKHEDPNTDRIEIVRSRLQAIERETTALHDRLEDEARRMEDGGETSSRVAGVRMSKNTSREANKAKQLASANQAPGGSVAVQPKPMKARPAPPSPDALRALKSKLARRVERDGVTATPIVGEHAGAEDYTLPLSGMPKPVEEIQDSKEAHLAEFGIHIESGSLTKSPRATVSPSESAIHDAQLEAEAEELEMLADKAAEEAADAILRERLASDEIAEAMRLKKEASERMREARQLEEVAIMSAERARKNAEAAAERARGEAKAAAVAREKTAGWRTLRKAKADAQEKVDSALAEVARVESDAQNRVQKSESDATRLVEDAEQARESADKLELHASQLRGEAGLTRTEANAAAEAAAATEAEVDVEAARIADLQARLESAEQKFCTASAEAVSLRTTADERLQMAAKLEDELLANTEGAKVASVHANDLATEAQDAVHRVEALSSEVLAKVDMVNEKLRVSQKELKSITVSTKSATVRSGPKAERSHARMTKVQMAHSLGGRDVQPASEMQIIAKNPARVGKPASIAQSRVMSVTDTDLQTRSNYKNPSDSMVATNQLTGTMPAPVGVISPGLYDELDELDGRGSGRWFIYLVLLGALAGGGWMWMSGVIPGVPLPPAGFGPNK